MSDWKCLSPNQLNEESACDHSMPRRGHRRTGGLDVQVERPVVCPAPKMPYSCEARHKEKLTSVLERLDRRSREGSMGSQIGRAHV